jgi:protein involved in polysaccharide export with SLBB domain
MRFIVIVAIIVAFAISAADAAKASDAVANRYLLGPQDRLMVRIYSLRKSTGEFYAWEPLNGEFTVGADGTLSMPIVGQVNALGKTAPELAIYVSQLLRAKADLVEPPFAAVEVMVHRPYYIMGNIRLPGRYEYQPGMTVLQAVSTAQGIGAPDINGNQRERDTIVSRGELLRLNVEQMQPLARMAGLRAEIAEAEEIDFPKSLADQADKSAVAEAMELEKLRFRTRRESKKAELDAIESAKVLLQKEIDTLQAKAVVLDKQVAINKRELDSVSDLVTKGLAVAPRQIALENAQVIAENNRLDVQLAALRAQQGLSTANRDTINVRARYHREALDDAALTNALIEQNKERMRTAASLLQEAQTTLADRGNEEIEPLYYLTRNGETNKATEATVLEAGDVVEVVVPLPFGLTERNQMPETISTLGE